MPLSCDHFSAFHSGNSSAHLSRSLDQSCLAFTSGYAPTESHIFRSSLCATPRPRPSRSGRRCRSFPRLSKPRPSSPGYIPLPSVLANPGAPPMPHCTTLRSPLITVTPRMRDSLHSAFRHGHALGSQAIPFWLDSGLVHASCSPSAGRAWSWEAAEKRAGLTNFRRKSPGSRS